MQCAGMTLASKLKDDTHMLPVQSTCIEFSNILPLYFIFYFVDIMGKACRTEHIHPFYIMASIIISTSINTFTTSTYLSFYSFC